MTIVLYGLALVTVGVYFRRQAGDAVGFFLAGRRLGALEVGLSLAATGFGGSAVLMASRLAYGRGLTALWFSGSVALGFGVLGLAFARRIRAGGAHSLADFIGRDYGEGLRRTVSLLLVIIEVAFFGLTVKSFALLTLPLMGGGASFWSASAGTIQVAVCVLFVTYTLLGGHRAVAATDLLQMVLIVAALFGLLLPMGLARTDFDALPPSMLDWPLSGPSGPVFALNMLVLMGLSGMVGGDVFSKILSARDPGTARSGALIAAALMAVLAAGVVVLAMCARGIEPALAQPELAIPELARHLLPDAMFQLVVLAFLSVLLSTGDSVLITGATVLALDVFKLHDRASAGAIRGLTAALAAAGLALALWMHDLLEIMKFGYTLLTASVAVPVLFVLVMPRRPSARVVSAAMATGLAVAVAWQWLARADLLVSPLEAATAGAAASAIVMSAGVLLIRSPAQ